jgi:hypothetical protein
MFHSRFSLHWRSRKSIDNAKTLFVLDCINNIIVIEINSLILQVVEVANQNWVISGLEVLPQWPGHFFSLIN